jgi:putative peptide zinc metalloprotease protein
VATALSIRRSEGPWRPRMRPDLHLSRHASGRQQRVWSVKDPLTLRHYHLADNEYFILRGLDGQTTLAELRERFERENRPKTLSDGELFAFVRHLYRQGLITVDAPGQASLLLERRAAARKQAWLGMFANPLAIRFRGIDPDRLLTWLAPRCGWMFSPWCIAACCLLMLAALGLVAVRFDEVAARLPSLTQMWTADTLVWLAIALSATKILHELAHAVACKHFGGECHELGVMLLAFTPCLYCNVTDVWQLPRARQRIAVSAAGMYVECVIAALCTFVWWGTEPGLLHNLALNVMIVASVSTLVFNGNPLLRYDGYYIVSDLLGVPNLAPRASTALRTTTVHALLGVELPGLHAESQRTRWPLIGYGMASFVYRLLVMAVFVWLVIAWSKQYGADVVGRGAALALVAMMAWPIVTTIRTVAQPTLAARMDRRRFVLRGGAIVLGLLAILAVPFPYSVRVPAMVEADDAKRLYVSSPGTLVESVSYGSKVKVSQPVARLENLAIALEVAQLRGQRNQQRLHVKNLSTRRVSDPQAAALLPAAEEALADVEHRLQERETDQTRLTLSSPMAGTVMPPTSLHVRPSPGALSAWSGAPLDDRNRSAFLETGTLVALVGDPDRLKTVLLVDQADVEFVEVGQRVRLDLDEAPGVILEGTIDALAEADSRIVPRELAAAGELPQSVDAHGHTRLQNTSYQAHVTLDPHHERLLLGTTGRAKISVAARSLGWRLYRYLSYTFRLDL